MKIGAIAIPKQKDTLAIDTRVFSHAVVVNTDPFVLVSQEGEILWACVKSEDFDFITIDMGIAEKLFYKAFKRYHGSTKPDTKQEIIEPIKVKLPIDFAGMVNFSADYLGFFKHDSKTAKKFTFHYLEAGAISLHLRQYFFNGYLDSNSRLLGFSQPVDKNGAPIQPAFFELIERPVVKNMANEIKLQIALDGITTFRTDIRSLKTYQYHYLEIGSILRHFDDYVFAGYFDSDGERYFEQPTKNGRVFCPEYIYLTKKEGIANDYQQD